MSTTIGTAVRARLTTMIKKRLDVVLQRYSLDGSAFYFYRRFGSRRRQVGRTQRMMMRCDWTACAVRSVVYRTFRVVGVFVSFVSWVSWVSLVVARGWSGGFGSRRRAADVMCGGVLGGD
jgi:hypothetical protein